MNRPLPTSILSILLVFSLYPTAAGQSFTFTLMSNNLALLEAPDAQFGDLDLDGEMDVLVAGQEVREFPLAITRAYIGVLEEQRSPPGGGLPRWVRDFSQFGFGISPVWLGAVAWIDADHDNDLEALAIGGSLITRPFSPRAALYDFVGSEWQTRYDGFPGLLGGSAAVGDYDNDGDEDILLTGSNEDNTHATVLFDAVGSAQYAESGVVLPGIGMGDGTFVDFDRDGDLDIFLVGDSGAGFRVYLLRNDGGAFSEIETGITPVAFASSSWADYDADGDLDLALSGGLLSGRLIEPLTRVFRNDGNGVFVDIGADLAGSYYGTVKWGDFDNDGDPDLMEVGGGFVGDRRVGLAFDNQNGTFVRGASLVGLGMSSSDVGDYDADGDLDVVIFGEGTAVLYRNDTDTLRAPAPGGLPIGHPEPPSGLASSVDGRSVTLSWSPASDDTTPADGLTYNIRVGSSPNALDVVTPSANREIGRRLFSRLGNVQNNTSWTLRNLPPGQYFWSVQTLDASYTWSVFAEEASFVVE